MLNAYIYIYALFQFSVSFIEDAFNIANSKLTLRKNLSLLMKNDFISYDWKKFQLDLIRYYL